MGRTAIGTEPQNWARKIISNIGQLNEVVRAVKINSGGKVIHFLFKMGEGAHIQQERELLLISNVCHGRAPRSGSMRAECSLSCARKVAPVRPVQFRDKQLSCP